MNETEPVYFNQAVVGQVRLEKQGMYYRIRCSCKLSDNNEYMLCCIQDDHTARLGTYVSPNELIARVLIKHIGCGRFILIPKIKDVQKIYHVQEAEGIYDILKNLPNLRLVFDNDGNAGVAITHRE